MKCSPEERFVFVYYSLISSVILVGEEHGPVSWQRVLAHGEPVILSGDEASVCLRVCTGLVVTSVTVSITLTSKRHM